MPASSWIAHVKAVYAKGKSKGMSYKDALRAAAKTWWRQQEVEGRPGPGGLGRGSPAQEEAPAQARAPGRRSGREEHQLNSGDQ